MKIEFIKGSRRISINDLSLLVSAEIWQVYEYANFVLVVLEPDTSLRNVLCFNEHAQLRWTIEETGFFPQREGPGYETVTREGRKRDGRLLAYSRGRPFYLDIDTGKVTFIPGNFEK